MIGVRSFLAMLRFRSGLSQLDIRCGYIYMVHSPCLVKRLVDGSALLDLSQGSVCLVGSDQDGTTKDQHSGKDDVAEGVLRSVGHQRPDGFETTIRVVQGQRDVAGSRKGSSSIHVRDSESLPPQCILRVRARQVLIDGQILHVVLNRAWIVAQVVIHACDGAIFNGKTPLKPQVGRKLGHLEIDFQRFLVVREGLSRVRCLQFGADEA